MSRALGLSLSLLFLFSCANKDGGDPPENLAPRDGTNGGNTEFLWTTESVRTDGNVGEWTNLLLASDDTPIVTHMEVSNPYQLHLSRGGTTAWTDTVVGVSGRLSSSGLGLRSGNPVIAYFDGTDIQYFENNLSHAVDRPGETGDWPSLTLNASNRIMIAYQRCFFGRDLCNDTSSDIRRDLRFAYSDNGTNWTTETVEVGTMDANSGFYTNIAIVNGQPIISYFNRTQSMVKVAVHKSGSFGIPANWTLVNVRNARGGDSRPAMAVSADGVVGISFYDPSTKDLYYTESADAGLTWSAPDLVDRLGDVGISSDIAFDASGQATIVYYDGTDRGEGEGLKIAWKKGDTWIAKSITRGVRMGQFPSIQFRSDGKPVVAHFDGLNADLMYSSFGGSAWPPDVQP